MRLSGDERDGNGRLVNGFDYDRQAWVVNGRYIRCGHPETMACKCYGREHAGQETKSPLCGAVINLPTGPRRCTEMKPCSIHNLEAK